MSSKINTYNHINSKIKIELSMEEIAKSIVKLNYGVHQLLSELVKQLRISQDSFNIIFPDIPERSELADGIEELLNKGYYK